MSEENKPRLDIPPIDSENEPVGVSKEEIELDILREKLESDKQDRKERKKYAMVIFWFLCSFLFVTLAIVVFTAIKIFDLSDTILITLLTTTSADIIGVFIIVVKYLFKPTR